MILPIMQWASKDGSRFIQRLCAGLPVAMSALALAGCSGPQSALDPGGDGAERFALLFWVMLFGSAVLWVGTLALAFFAARTKRGRFDERTGSALILWGAVFSTAVLTALLIYGLSIMPDTRGPGDGLTINVTGEQYWWRVRYRPKDDPPVESANEIRVPAGERVEFLLDAADVIHSFWIPSLGGKVDMIPGRTNRLVLHATKPGVYRGVCAEFCGRSHALMAFSVVVMERADFDRWLAAQRGAASASASRGAELFLAQGCGACHAVRSTEARGAIGPDLTHFGERRTVGAGILDNTKENVARFILEVESIKPGSRMPSYSMLSPEEANAIADYLGSLR